MNFLIIIFLLMSFIKILRWLAILQQKEYRLDRLFHYLRTDAGFREVIFIPKLKNFSRTGLKRPVFTNRVIVIALLSLFLVLLLFSQIANLDAFFSELIMLYVVLYAYLPVVVLMATIPTSVLSYFVTRNTLHKAKEIIKSNNPIIIGITGSYGKTSTKYLLAHFLSSKFSVFFPPSSYNTKYSISKSIVSDYKGEEIVIIEYGAYKRGEIKTLTNYFPPNYAVITGITPQHLELFGSMKDLLKAKTELVDSLPKQGVVFCNSDDKNALKVCNRTNLKTKHYSSQKPILKFSEISLDKVGKIILKHNKRQLKTKLIGKHYFNNIQSAAVVSKHFDLTDDQIIKALESFEPPSSFIQSSILKSRALLVDDSGTANPKGFEAAIDLTKSLKRKRNILLFGGIVDLGIESKIIHQNLANSAKVIFTEVCYTGDEGKIYFQKVFSDKLIDSETDILKNLRNINKNSLILIEGKIPVIISKIITKNLK